MAQVLMPPRKNKSQELFQVAGAVVGGVTGGPTGAMQGAQMGGAVSNMVNQPKQVAGTQASAISRRRQELETDNLSALRNAEVAAADLPEDQRQAVIPVLTQARLLEQKKRGMA